MDGVDGCGQVRVNSPGGGVEVGRMGYEDRLEKA